MLTAEVLGAPAVNVWARGVLRTVAEFATAPSRALGLCAQTCTRPGRLGLAMPVECAR